MNEKEKQPYKDIIEHLKDSNFNNIVMEAFELMCGETVEMDLHFDNYPMAHTKYRETEASKKSIEFSKKYHGTSVVVKLALEQREKLLKWKDSQQDLIKGKDEYIAKLCCDRAELKEHEKELIAEQHRLFDLSKEQENELNDLRKLIGIILFKPYWEGRFRWIKECKNVDEYNFIFNKTSRNRLTQDEFDLLKKVVEKYGK